MRTTHVLTVSPSMLCTGGGCAPRGVGGCVLPGGLSAAGGGWVSALGVSASRGCLLWGCLLLGGGVCFWGCLLLGGVCFWGVSDSGGCLLWGCLLLGGCLLWGGVCFQGVSASGGVCFQGGVCFFGGVCFWGVSGLGVSASGGLLLRGVCSWGCLLLGVSVSGGICSGRGCLLQTGGCVSAPGGCTWSGGCTWPGTAPPSMRLNDSGLKTQENECYKQCYKDRSPSSI